MRLRIYHPRSDIRTSRPAFSMTEVLLAMFVMAIGMISLLVLFPIGMLNMQAAMRQSRMAFAVGNAEAMAEMARPGPAGTITLRTDPLLPTSLTQAYVTTQATAVGLDAFTAAGPFEYLLKVSSERYSSDGSVMKFTVPSAEYGVPESKRSSALNVKLPMGEGSVYVA